MDQFTTEEKAIIDWFLADLSDKAKYQISLESLLSRWNKFVNEVEKGYADSIYEYVNDLSARDVIEQLGKVLPAAGREKLMKMVESEDARFYANTSAIEMPLRTQTPDLGLWWFRVPKVMSSELGNELKERLAKAIA